MPALPAAAVLSFLKDTRGALNWAIKDLAKTLNLTMHDAKQVIPVLQIQGYIKPSHDHLVWITTPAGEVVSGSKPPRYTRQSINQALASFAHRIKQANKDPNSPFKITKVVAFGDFLSDNQRLQAPDVAIELAPRGSKPEKSRRAKDEPVHHISPEERSAHRAFLKNLRGKTQFLSVQFYQPWMSARSHRNLL